MQNRLRFISIAFLVGICALGVRLFYWQVVKGEDLSRQAKTQQKSASQRRANRGNILARDMSHLVASRDQWLLFGDMPLVEDPKALAETLSTFTSESTEVASVSAEKSRLLTIFSETESSWVPLKNRLTTETKKKLDELELKGIGFEAQESRYYPEASAAAHLLGFLGKDNEGNDTGYFGLEGYYDLVLSGKPGFVERESNAAGVPILFGEAREKAAQHGVDLVTGVDKTIQILVEKHLKKGIEKYGAKAGSIIVMDPMNGAILAMAATPSYDASRYWEFNNADFVNPITSYSFEPGSIMKPLVMAAGFDAGVITPESICDICNAPYKVDKYFIETWDQKYHANSTMQDIIIRSDNVGMVYIGNKLGSDKLYDYFDSFGFGRLTNIDLQGEMSPQMRPRGTWNIVDQATASFGQGIAVTPLQMITAFSIIANGGYQVVPHVVEKLASGDWSHEISFPKGKQVLSTKATTQMKDILVGGVKYGEAKWAVPKGYRVAGKTGTAQIAVSGHYDEEKTNASFIAYAPPENPKFVMLITLSEPESSQWASETAAPLWFTIARDIFPHMGIKPEN